jgi:predicted site-specific integrase-resolvase
VNLGESGESVVLVDTLAAAAAVSRPAGTVRRWANEGRIVRQGTDKKGRTLYRLEDVYRAAANLRYGRGPVTSARPF